MIRPRLSPTAVALLCVLIYLDTEGFVPPFLLAALLHETAHLLVLRCFGSRPADIQIGLTGAVISTVFKSPVAEFLSTLAGTAANLFLALTFRRLWPAFCLANTVLLIYNLLPVYPLDGGRLFRLFFVWLFGQNTGETIVTVLGIGTVCAVAAACIYASFDLHYGLFPCLIAAIFVLRLPKTLVKQTNH